MRHVLTLTGILLAAASVGGQLGHPTRLAFRSAHAVEIGDARALDRERLLLGKARTGRSSEAVRALPERLVGKVRPPLTTVAWSR